MRMGTFVGASTFTLFACIAGVACGSSSSDDSGVQPGDSGTTNDANGGGTDASGGTDSSTPSDGGGDSGSEWVPLISRSWSVSASSEKYVCTALAAATDMDITGFQSTASTGVISGVVTKSTTAVTTGDTDCSSSTFGAAGLLNAYGPTTAPIEFPADTSMHVAAGEYVMLRLHVFATATDLTGTSGVSVRLASSTTAHVAQMDMAGTVSFTVPGDSTPHTYQGSCTVDTEAKIFAMIPFMFQSGTHAKVVHHAASDTTILDQDFTFGTSEQFTVLATPEDFAASDHLQTACTFSSSTLKNSGDSVTTSEECFVGTYYVTTRATVPGPYDCSGGGPI